MTARAKWKAGPLMRPSSRLCVVLGLWLACGSIARAHGDLHQQIDDLTRVLRRSPSAELFHKRGELYRAHGDHKAALDDYARAERLDPSLRVVRLSRGRTLLEAGALAQAAEVLAGYLREQPDHIEARMLLARAHMHLGQHARAEAEFARAMLHIAEPTPDLYLERAANLNESSERAAALRVIEAGIARLGPLVTLHEAALRLECEGGQWDAALARIDGILVGLARPESWLARKAEILEQAGRADAASAVRREALASLERLPEARRRVPSMQQLEARLRAQPAGPRDVTRRAR